MRDQPPSQNIADLRRQQEFVGREDELTAFREFLNSAPGEARHRMIVNLVGDGGIGKTWLMRQMQQAADNSEALTAYADGHILAMDKGRSGESYILAGPAVTYKQMMEMWQGLCGIPAPRLWLPGWIAGLGSQFAGGLEKVFRLNTPISSEVLTTQANYTYYATADKARRELGWQPRPLEQIFKEVLDDKLAQRKR